MSTSSIKTSPPLRFGIEDNTYRKDGPDTGEFYYRIELADGREAVIAASTITVADGALVAITKRPARESTEILGARDAAEFSTLVLAPGTWVSAYMCEALMAYDPWSILGLRKPDDAN